MASTGIMIGVLGGLAPTRKRDVSEVVFRAMVAGNVACFMTACIAGRYGVYYLELVTDIPKTCNFGFLIDS